VGAAVGGDGDVTAVACVSGIELHRGGSKVAFVKADWDPLSVAMSHDGAHVAVGGKVSAFSLVGRAQPARASFGASVPAMLGCSVCCDCVLSMLRVHPRDVYARTASCTCTRWARTA
jgi:hypothetical protein